VAIGIIGKYTSLRDSYASIIQALEHAGARLSARVRMEWIDSSDLTDANVAEKLKDMDGVIVPGGFGFRGVDGKLACIQHVRECGIPYLGICYGIRPQRLRHDVRGKHGNRTRLSPTGDRRAS
jgi:CTP synthase